MISQRIICNVKTGQIIRESVENDLPEAVDYIGEIEVCKQRLADTDYAVIKIAEGAATREEYADLLAERQSLRERIREMEKLLAIGR